MDVFHHKFAQMMGSAAPVGKFGREMLVSGVVELSDDLSTTSDYLPKMTMEQGVMAHTRVRNWSISISYDNDDEARNKTVTGETETDLSDESELADYPNGSRSYDYGAIDVIEIFPAGENYYTPLDGSGYIDDSDPRRRTVLLPLSVKLEWDFGDVFGGIHAMEMRVIGGRTLAKKGECVFEFLDYSDTFDLFQDSTYPNGDATNIVASITASSYWGYGGKFNTTTGARL